MSALIAPTADSVREGIAAAFPFKVQKLPLYGPDNLRTPHYGLFRDDSGECVGSTCKRGYVPHDRDDVATLAEAASGAFSEASSIKLTARFLGGHRLILGPTDDYIRSLSGSRDTISPRLIVRAGYDGRAFSAWLGIYRGVCENLEIIQPEGVGVSASIRHSGSMRLRLSELTDRFRELAASYDSVVETVERMQQREVEIGAFVREIYPERENDTRRAVNANRQRFGRILQRVHRERVTLGENRGIGNLDTVSVWEALNGVQGYVQHQQTRQGSPDAFKRAILAIDSPHVAKANELAMAAIAV